MVCVALAGCITSKAVNEARGNPGMFLHPVHPDEATTATIVMEKTTEPNPSMYALIPFTLVADIVTGPIQIWAWLTDYRPCK